MLRTTTRQFHGNNAARRRSFVKTRLLRFLVLSGLRVTNANYDLFAECCTAQNLHSFKELGYRPTVYSVRILNNAR